MNRIQQLVKGKIPADALDIPDFPTPPEERQPTDPPKQSYGKTCYFCGDELEGQDFKAFSGRKETPAAICGGCVKMFARMKRFAESFDVYWHAEPDYKHLRKRIAIAMSGERGTSKMRRLLTDLIIMLIQRSSALLAGHVSPECPRTGVPLAKQRIALVGKNAKECAKLMSVGCDEVGIALIHTTRQDLKSGIAFHELIKFYANGEANWAEHGVLFCDGYVRPEAPCSIIYACETAEGLPDDVSVINVDGFDASDLC